MATKQKGSDIAQNALTELGWAERIVSFSETTHTAADAAKALGCQVAEIAKTLIFKTVDNEPIIVIASGKNRIDVNKLQQVVGKEVGKADADFVLESTDYIIGAVSPLGAKIKSLGDQGRIYIDDEILDYCDLWAAAGSANSTFSLTPAELIAITKGKPVDVKEE